MSDYAYWTAMLAGKPIDSRLPAQPEAGFYRRRRNDKDYRAALKDGTASGPAWSAVAIWYDGEWCCSCQHGFEPTRHDEICELFASVGKNAITEEVYRAVIDGQPWPDEVAERAAPERIGPTETQEAMYGQGATNEPAPAEIGHNSGEVAPFEIIRERIVDASAQLADYLKSIGGKPTTQAHADKVTNFGSMIADIEKEAIAAHKAAKQPWLDGGRKVDDEWRDALALGAAEKKRIKLEILTPCLQALQRAADAAAQAERDRLLEESRRAQDEAAKHAEQTGEWVTPPAPPMPLVEAPKVTAGTRGKATGLRNVPVYEITDRAAFVAFIMAMASPPPDFTDVLQKLANRMGAAGVTPAGVTKKFEQRAA